MNNHPETRSIRNGRKSAFCRLLKAGALTLALAALTGTWSCQMNPDQGQAAEVTDGGGSYTNAQKLFCLNILSNIPTQYNYHRGDTILDSTIYAVDTVLGNPGVQQLIGKWKCVWGPAVLTSVVSAKGTPIAANTMYIAKSLDNPGVYVAAIAGTDPMSITDWIGEDADVIYTRYWDSVLVNLNTNTYKPNINLGKPFISRATNRGLYNIMNLKDTLQPPNTRLASDFLRQLIQQATPQAPVTIWTTGHSLGGALAPTLALYLNDMWAKANANVAIGCMAVAGATPGNQYFADLFQSELGTNYVRVWNQRDVVPHGYASLPLKYPPPPFLTQVDTIYNMAGIQTPSPGTIDALAATLSLYRYTQLQNTNTGFQSAFYDSTLMLPGCTTNADTFLGQLGCQHVPAYGAYFRIGDFQTAMQQVLGLKYPFFSSKFKAAPIVIQGTFPVINSLVLTNSKGVATR